MRHAQRLAPRPVHPHGIPRLRHPAINNVARKNPAAAVEEWFSNKNQLVSEVEKVLFEELNIGRRLRTASIQHPHRHIAICAEEEQLRRLRLRLFQYI